MNPLKTIIDTFSCSRRLRGCVITHIFGSRRLQPAKKLPTETQPKGCGYQCVFRIATQPLKRRLQWVNYW
ncbi:MAG: hypothetical protein AB1349_05445 [Elusimicrobiota bacterium]